MSTDANGEAGSVSVELTLLLPLLVLVLLFVVTGGRLADAQARVDQATYSAARAASLARDPASATDAARATATGALSTCQSLDLAVDTAAFVPGGAVTVRATCVVGLADLTGLGLPGSTMLTSTSTSPIDRFRAVTP